MSIRNHVAEWLGLLSMVARSGETSLLKDVGKWFIFALFGWWLATIYSGGRLEGAVEACTRKSAELEERMRLIEQHGAPVIQRQLETIRQELRDNRTLIIEHMNNQNRFKQPMQGP